LSNHDFKSDDFRSYLTLVFFYMTVLHCDYDVCLRQSFGII